MQLFMMKTKTKKRINSSAIVGLLLISLLAACDKPMAAGNKSNKVDGSSTQAEKSYEIVTVTRPVSLDRPLSTIKTAYDVCAASAKALALPVIAFPALPKDYFEVRNTYISDGVNFYQKSEVYVVDTASFEEQCASKFGIESSTTIVRGNKTQRIEMGQDGLEYKQFEPNNFIKSAAFKKSDVEVFSLHRTKSGISMRCIDPSTVDATMKDDEQCVYDGPNNSSLFDGMNKLIDLHVRVSPMIFDSKTDSVRVTDVQVFQLGKTIDSKFLEFK
jgi:hypothetical protein